MDGCATQNKIEQMWFAIGKKQHNVKHIKKNI